MTEANRRPIRSRQAAVLQGLAAALAGRGVRPNRISQASMAAALLGGLCLAGVAWTDGAGPTRLLLVLAALMIQLRLLCNLIDGMVAVEGGLKEPDGPFWNEAPDRVSDILLLAGAGVGAGAPWLGLAAGALAVMTAYLRELGRAEGLAPDFSGPFAKPQRMAVLTLGAVLGLVLVGQAQQVLLVTLILLTLGTALTCALRARRLIAGLQG